MTTMKHAWTERELKYWMRPDAHRFLRPDWRRFWSPERQNDPLYRYYDSVERKYRISCAMTKDGLRMKPETRVETQLARN